MDAIYIKAAATVKTATAVVNGVTFTRKPEVFGNRVADYFAKKVAPKTVSNLDEIKQQFTEKAERVNSPYSGILGTSLPGSGLVAVSSNYRSRPFPDWADGDYKKFLVDFNSKHRLARRDTYAHEAFHAKNPFLGTSELLPRLYGGYRSPLPGASLRQRLSSAYAAYKEFTPDLQKRYYGERIGGPIANDLDKMLMTYLRKKI